MIIGSLQVKDLRDYKCLTRRTKDFKWENKMWKDQFNPQTQSIKTRMTLKWRKKRSSELESLDDKELFLAKNFAANIFNQEQGKPVFNNPLN